MSGNGKRERVATRGSEYDGRRTDSTGGERGSTRLGRTAGRIGAEGVAFFVYWIGLYSSLAAGGFFLND